MDIVLLQMGGPHRCLLAVVGFIHVHSMPMLCETCLEWTGLTVPNYKKCLSVGTFQDVMAFMSMMILMTTVLYVSSKAWIWI